MPDTFTPNLGLVQPEVGASRDTWGTKWNQNATILDQFVSRAMPIGAILDFAGPNAPSGWLIADGRTVSRTTYSALFAVLGTYWGAGDGSTTFNLPSPNGRASIGPGSVVDTNGVSTTFTFTQKTGAVTNVIAKVNLPNYAMASDAQGNHSHGGATAGGGGHNHTTDAQGYHSHGDWTAVDDRDHTHSGTTDTQGSHAHNYSTLNFSPGGGLAGGGAVQLFFISQATDVQGAHAHNFTTGGRSTGHLHQIYGDGSHGHNISFASDHVHGINGDGTHSHNVALGGSGVAFPVLQPVLVVTKIIYAGAQAATALDALSTPVGLLDTMEATDDLAAIRQELAELRAILAPPRPLRVMTTPSRGPH